jgi:mono/diheme cytochrome c family protein
MRAAGWLSGAVFAVGACGSPKAPETPSWYDDVQPIIQGSCAHCHGPTAAVTGSGNRFDVCDSTPFTDAGFSFVVPGKSGWLGGRKASNIAGFVVSDGGRAQMPPPPAGELSDYERDVIVNFSMNATCPKRPGNHKPTVKLLGKLNYTDTDLVLTVDVLDADAETVLGVVTAGPLDAPVATAQINGSGRNKLTLTGVTAADLPVHVKVSDGTDLVERDL